METFNVEGVILNTVNFGDSNRVVTLYTKEFGKLEANAYGCRRARSPLSGAIQMFNKICAEIKHGTHVDTIRDADILNFYSNLTADIDRLSYAAILFEIVNKMTLPRVCEVGIYNLLINALPAFNDRNPKIAALIAVAQFMEFTGFQLNFKSCVRCGRKIEGDALLSLSEGGAICEKCSGVVTGYNYTEELRQTFLTALNFDWRAENKITLSARQVQKAEKILFQYVQNVLGSELRALKFLQATAD